MARDLQLLSLKEAARVLNIQDQRLRLWADKGLIECFRTLRNMRLFDARVVAAKKADIDNNRCDHVRGRAA